MLGLEPGMVVGKVVDVIEVAQWLLKIRLANPVKDADGVVVENSALVPFVDELVPDIDLEEGYLTLDPPGGLFRDCDRNYLSGGHWISMPTFCFLLFGRHTGILEPL